MRYLKNFNTLLEYEDALILDIPNTSYIVEDKEVKYSEEPKISSKYIVYKSSDGLKITPYNTNSFDALLISNKYDDFGLISFNDSLTVIGYSAFSGCKSLISITIPNSVTRLMTDAFGNCSSLTSITIPNSVTSIGDYTFMYCSSLTSITIPNSVTSIGNGAFSNCSSLRSINVDSNNPNYSSVDGVLFNKDKTTLVAYPGGKQSAYTIPNSMRSIGEGAFSSYDSLTSITCQAVTPPTLGSNNKLSNVTVVYVPAESVETYKTATNWSYYADKIYPIQ